MQKSLYSIRMEYWHESYNSWVSQEIFSFPWLFNITFLIILYIVWIKVVDKHRLRELLLFGSLLSVASVLVDTIAVTIGLWEYKVSLLPLSPAPFPFDYTVIPIFYMLILQYTSTKRNYYIGSIFAAAIFSFIIEPIYVWIGIKEFHKFNFIYMFILVLIISSAIKIIYDWIVSIELRSVGNKDK